MCAICTKITLIFLLDNPLTVSYNNIVESDFFTAMSHNSEIL